MNYIFSKEERNLYKIFLSVYYIICLLLLFLTIFAAIKASDIKSALLAMACIIIAFGPPLIYALIYQKYRFAKYEFSDNSVANIIKNEKRIICRNEPFKTALVTMRHGRPQGRYQEQKFIVIGKKDAVFPDNDDEISPYIAMKKFDIILLPYSKETVSQIYVSLGVLVNYIEDKR